MNPARSRTACPLAVALALWSGLAGAPGEAAAAPDAAGGGWAWKPLVRPAVPPGAAHPVDAFIRARLDGTGIRPSPEADRRTLARRLSFDLTGLPPAPEQVAAFVADPDPRAYERLVDALLASPRHGEHWARHWLDAASYADTHGNDHDYARTNAWPYRDYVIQSFNCDKPYARFLQEQVAGDALFPDDPAATVALGFLAAGPWDETLMVGVREDTVDHRIAQNLDRDNLVSTVMGTFQSLTVHCARCHDHKFDPISQRDYYALQAVFAGVDRVDRPYGSDARTETLRRELTVRQKAVAARDPAILASPGNPEITHAVAAVERTFQRRLEGWKPLDVTGVTHRAPRADTTFTRQADGSWRVDGVRPDQDTFEVTIRSRFHDLRALRLEVLPDPSLPHGGPGRFDNGNLHLSEFKATLQRDPHSPGAAIPLRFTKAAADHSDGTDVVANAIDGRDATYWSIHPRYAEAHEAVFELSEPLELDDTFTLTVLLEFKGKTGHQAGRFRLSACSGALDPADRAPLPAELAVALRRPAGERTPEQIRELVFLALARDIGQSLARLPEPRLVFAVGNQFEPRGSLKPAVTPRPIRLLARGEIDRPRELVGPAALRCIAGLDADLHIPVPEDESARRAALARWLADDRNSLTWRSIVNRVWHHHFGRGICDTPNDFGRMGGQPSHPELLDWLAVWFRDDARGSLKALHRLIVTSATYRQASLSRPDAMVKDTDNRLLWRMNSPRLTAEEVRDAALLFAGRLDFAMGGPAAIQFRHRGPATFMPEGGAPPFLDYGNFDPDSPEGARRAVYRFVFRTVPDPFMAALDCPDGAALTPVRNVSTTALQALAMLNDAFLIRQCEHLAERLARETHSPESQARAAFETILQRPSTAAEESSFGAYVRKHGLANACHLLLNSNEFLHPD